MDLPRLQTSFSEVSDCKQVLTKHSYYTIYIILNVELYFSTNFNYHIVSG